MYPHSPPDHHTVFDRYAPDGEPLGDAETVVASGDRHDRGVETLCVGEAA
jgi:hypothetical protein